MARIGSYTTDDNVTGSDKVLGTDSGGTTKNYELDSIADYFSKNNTIAVAGQVAYQYKSSPGQNLSYAQFTSNEGGGGDNILMSAIQDIIIYKALKSNLPVDNLLKDIFNDKFRIHGISSSEDYYDFTVTRIEEWPDVNNSYKVSLAPISGNASSTFSNDEYYAISTNSGDKTYVHDQGVASATWSITHNLNKKPSVTVVDSAENVVIGEIEYNNDTSITITFSGAFSGKAYLN